MNKKQAGIILTLLALIVCAAILSAKVSGKLDDGTGSLSETINFNKDKGSAQTSTKDYFYDARNDREQSAATTIETLKQVSNNATVEKATRDDANKKLIDMTINKNNQTKVEIGVKAKGYDDAICSIEKDCVKVVVKSKDELTEKQSIQIQDVVKNVTSRSDVRIERKQ